MAEYNTLRDANIARDKEWAKENILSLSFRGNELAGEVGEACNILKKLDREQMGIVGSRASLDDLADELSDVIICVDLIGMSLGLDLTSKVKDKFNKTSEKYGLETRYV